VHYLTPDPSQLRAQIASASEQLRLMRRLLRLAEREHLLLITLHQVICDGWSLGVLVGELTALYDAFFAGRQTPLAPLSGSFFSFSTTIRKSWSATGSRRW